MRRLAFVSLIAAAVTCVFGSPALASSAPSQALVKTQIAKVLGNKLEFQSVRIAAGRTILNEDAGRLSIPPRTTIYPVLAKYTEYRKNGIVQDVTQYWYCYRDDFGWACQMVAHPGNRAVERR